MNLRFLALPLIGLFAPGPVHAQEPVMRRAVVVGAHHGGSLLETLAYAESDAAKMADLLVDIGGFDADDVTVLIGPTVSDVAVTLYEVAGDMGTSEESLFLFYYSGHADEIGLRINGGLLPYAELKDAIRMVPADVHLGILDACRSGAITQIKGASVAAPFLQIDSLGAEGEAWLAASSADEDAQESDLLEGSFFTYYLLSGLRGAADTGDGFVSLHEAYSYARDRTVARTAGTQGGTQHPAYDYRIQGNGELKLTEVRLASARITLPADIAGEIAVLRLPERTPVAEVAKADGTPVTLALEAGTYLLRRRLEYGVQEVTIHLSDGSELVVDRWGDTVAEIAMLKGEGDVDGDGIAEAVPEDAVIVDSPDTMNAAGLANEGGGQPLAEPAAGEADRDPVLLRIPIKYSDTPWELSIPRVDWEKLDDSPGLAGGLSVVPGLGHFYDKRWGRGAFFMASTISLYSVGFGIAPSSATKTLTGPNVLTFLAVGFHAWAIADAAWGVHRKETFAVRRGGTLSLETGWNGSDAYVSGFAFDLFPVKSLSIGLDRTGVIVEPDATVFTFGTRMTFGPSWKRWRMAALLAVGSRVDVPHASETPTEEHVDVAFVIGTGALLRVYMTPRYFLQTEGRVEWVDGDVAPLFGLGMGFHLGK